MSIGIVGAGNMGRSIATHLAKTGEDVALTDRNPGKAEAVVAEIAGDGVSAADLSDALASDVVVLALWYPGTTDFAGDQPPSWTGRSLSISATRSTNHGSGSRPTRRRVRPSCWPNNYPGSRIVKAFNTTHAPALAEGQVDEVALDVLLASDDDAAKSQVGDLVKAAGMRPIDAGRLDNARLLERLTAFQIELSQRYGLDYRLTF